jgi:hypothetical protein
VKRPYLLYRPAPPLWFLLLLCLLEAALWRSLGGLVSPAPPATSPLPDLTLAWWAIVMLVAGWVWTGVQVAGRITLTLLSWSVKVLWAFATAINNAAVAIGRAFVEFGRKAWDFIQVTYERVLRPAWQKFWEFFDKTRRWLESVFRPVLEFLDRIRSYVLRFYETYVRPILDVIGIARRVLGILASLGLDWAQKLDEKLRWLEEKIEAPFRIAIAKINEAIGIINRVVTADGLFQRLAYVRTLERDMRYLNRAFANWRSKPTPDADFQATKKKLAAKTPAELERDAIAHIDGTGGPRAALISEMVQHWTIQIERR